MKWSVRHHPDAARLVYLGLYALQHRGQESAGVAVSDGNDVTRHIGMGLVADIFDKAALEPLFKGDWRSAISRYLPPA